MPHGTYSSSETEVDIMSGPHPQVLWSFLFYVPLFRAAYTPKARGEITKQLTYPRQLKTDTLSQPMFLANNHHYHVRTQTNNVHVG